jgi:hypothetical protein
MRVIKQHGRVFSLFILFLAMCILDVFGHLVGA